VARNFRAEKWAGQNKSPREAAVGQHGTAGQTSPTCEQRKKGRGLSGSMDERFGSCEICAHTEQDSKREKQLIQGNKKRQKSFTGRGLVADRENELGKSDQRTPKI
jgi:hypothetical protein